jgi:hypothetical protein
MPLYRCTGCRQYSSEDRHGELSGVTYTTKHFFDSYEGHAEPDEHDDRCELCGTDIDEFDEIASEHAERFQRKLGMPLDEIAKYLNNFKL